MGISTLTRLRWPRVTESSQPAGVHKSPPRGIAPSGPVRPEVKCELDQVTGLDCREPRRGGPRHRRVLSPVTSASSGAGW
jgi:hypothetical protein